MFKALAGLVLCVAALSGAACSRAGRPAPAAAVETHAPRPEPTVSAREILSRQPDFVADEVSSSVEGAHGHSFTSKVAKKGEYYRTEGPIVVVFHKAGEPMLRYWRPAKMFLDERLPGSSAWYADASRAEIFARVEGVRFEVVGTEEVEGRECLKIKAWPEAEARAGEKDRATVYLYAAKDLRNLVVATELLLPDRKTTYVLKNISLEAPDELFKVLARRRR